MRSITSKKQDAKVKAELLKEGALKYKLAHLDNDAIAVKLYEDGLGVEVEGKLAKPYSGSYIGKVIRETLKEIAAERVDHGKSVAILLEAELDELIEHWRPYALDPDAPSIKAADLVRKLIQQKAEMLGANAPITQQIEIKYQNDVENFVTVLRALMPEEHFNSVILAIDQATTMNSEYWSEQKALKSADDATIDIEAE